MAAQFLPRGRRAAGRRRGRGPRRDRARAARDREEKAEGACHGDAGSARGGSSSRRRGPAPAPRLLPRPRPQPRLLPPPAQQVRVPGAPPCGPTRHSVHRGRRVAGAQAASRSWVSRSDSGPAAKAAAASAWDLRFCFVLREGEGRCLLVCFWVSPGRPKRTKSLILSPLSPETRPPECGRSPALCLTCVLGEARVKAISLSEMGAMDQGLHDAHRCPS